MEYKTNRTSYNIPNASLQGLYDFQASMYERVIKYSRSPPKGDYMTGGSHQK